MADTADPPLERIDDLARRLAARALECCVLAEGPLRLTGRQLEEAVETAAARLDAAGVRRGDRVVIAGENGVALAVGLFAVSRLGAWTAIVNARLTAAELDAIRAHCRPRATLYTVGCSPAAADLARGDATRPFDLGLAASDGSAAMAIDGPHDSRPETAGDEVAVLIYTSGSTGEPKSVMLTHANLLFIARTSVLLRRLGPGDRIYGVLPISHVFGLASVFLGTLYGGGELCLVPRFDAEAVAAALADEGITVFQGVPAMYARLLELAALRGTSLPAPALRYLSAGGAPLDPALKHGVEAMWGQPLHNGYGLTEAAPTISATRIDDWPRDDTVGPVLPGVEVRIVDMASGAAAAPGEVGELWARGPNVMKGYYRDPEQTATVLTADGWLKTGDLARLDEAGNLYIVGRHKELIIHSGFNVYPAEVEAALRSHPDVALVAVLGRKLDGNEEVVAFVQPIAGRRIDLAALQAHAAERLAPYKRPTRYLLREALPATPAGKILKARLAAEIAEWGDAPA